MHHISWSGLMVLQSSLIIHGFHCGWHHSSFHNVWLKRQHHCGAQVMNCILKWNYTFTFPADYEPHWDCIWVWLRLWVWFRLLASKDSCSKPAGGEKQEQRKHEHGHHSNIKLFASCTQKRLACMQFWGEHEWTHERVCWQAPEIVCVCLWREPAWCIVLS